MGEEETKIQRQIKDYLEYAGYKVYRMNAGRAKKNVVGAPAGTPDLLSISPKGRHLWIEIKTEEGVLSGVQASEHRDLIRRGDSVIVARSVEDVEIILNGNGHV